VKRLATVVAAVLVLQSTAHAEPAIVGLLDLRGYGVTDVVLAKFGESVEEGLSGSHDFQAASRDRMQEMLQQSSWSPACTVGPCLSEVHTQTGADYVVTAGLTGSGESYRFTLTLVATSTGDVAQQISQSCPACTVEDLGSAATLATIELINGVDTAAPKRPHTVPIAEVKRIEANAKKHAHTLRSTSVLTLGVALVTGALGGYFVHKGRTDVGYPLLGATAGLATSGVVMLGLSFRF
jgi:hypothetical protein